jgi:hypothetical protein
MGLVTQAANVLLKEELQVETVLRGELKSIEINRLKILEQSELLIEIFYT